MSYLVSDFLINPVLRQARRFSRSNTPGGRVEPTDHESPAAEIDHEVAIVHISEQMGSLSSPQAGRVEDDTTFSGTALTSSPVEEEGGIEAELQVLENGRHATGPTTQMSVSGRSLRVASLRTEIGQADDETTDNPSFGIPDRFRADSGASTTFNNVVGGGMSPAEGQSQHSTLDIPRAGSLNRPRNGSLPEDDGMKALRQQIIHIQSLEVPAEQKAHMMHLLLTKDYAQIHAKQHLDLPAPEGMISQERPVTPTSLSSFIWQMNGSPDPAAAEPSHMFHLSPDDLDCTYALPDPPEMDEDGDVIVREELPPVLGCRHYKRNVKLQCSACDKWYTCRLCHDEAEDHVLDRKATKNMLCMICKCAQGASEFCVGCGERTAWYYCGICKLWDNDPHKDIYHCNDCGICRKGRGLGKDFFHCKTCGICMSMAVEKFHKCIERVSDCDCPICGEYMFNSTSPVVFMLCGHSIHRGCYDEHMKSSYKCPICSKSTVNMETQFRNLDRAIDSQPMPPQFRDTKAMVSCNDCYAKSAVAYHWLGLKCAICDSYNVAQLSIISDPAIEVPQMENREIATPSDQVMDEISPGPFTAGMTRGRRHSSITQSTSSGLHGLVFHSRTVQRGRSVSPIRGPSMLDDDLPVGDGNETDDSADDDGDDLDFWGRDEPRSVTSAEVVDDEMEDEEDSDSDEGMDCEEDDEEEGEDRFALFGHR